MEEQKEIFTKETFTRQEVADIVSKMQNDYNVKMQECNRNFNALNSTLNRVGFLLTIINSPNIHVFNEKFINKCAEEVEYILTVPEEEEEPKNEE